MELIKDYINKLIAPSITRVGVYVSSDGKMEMIYYNTDTEEIYKCERKQVSYNQAIRELDIQEFEATLLEMLANLEIPPNTPICVCLPSVLTSIKEFPSELEDIELEVALCSEAEKSYVFKKAEPQASWVFLAENPERMTNTYLYSIVPKPQIVGIKDIFERHGLNLFCIDVSFSSLVRGLNAAGLIKEDVENNLNWCLITVSINNYMIAKFDGDRILNVIEKPLALKSIEPESLYSTLNSTIFDKMQQENLSSIYMISQTAEFEAAQLAEHVSIISKLHTIDKNKYNDNSLFSTAMCSYGAISPEVIGTASWNKSQMNINFDFKGEEDGGQIQGVLGDIGVKKPIHLYLLGGVVLSVILAGVLALFGMFVNNTLKSQVEKQNAEINKYKSLNVRPTKEFDVIEVVNESYTKNLDLVSFYDIIGAVIPEKLWIKSFFIDKDLHIKINGSAYNVEDIIIYYENLKEKAKFKNLKIESVEISSKSNMDNNKNNDVGLQSIVNTARNTQASNRSSSRNRSGFRNNSLNPFGNMNRSNPTNRENNMNTEELGNNDIDMALPAPPVPEQTSNKQKKHYDFVFKNYRNEQLENQNQNDLPDFVKNLFGN